MKSYIGIDLGTTNSAICSYEDGQTHIWKSREQNDVTPSAIYIGRRNNTYVGKRAYDSAPLSPGNVAMLFKRFMGTSTPIKLPAVDITMTPEECSSKILRELFLYLKEELREALRSNPELGTVITVPAAFNQMQKNATMEAAEQAGIGGVALMQEPVAAVMGIMKARDTDGAFLVYDLGGGTLDIALAESIGGHISLLAHGGIPMCGGRDFDRLIMANVVKPWLCKTFDLPDDWSANPDYGKKLLSLATWAAERAKIELSSREEAVISLSEPEEACVRDQGIYLDIPIDRSTLTELIKNKVNESIVAARETLEKAGLSPHDIERIVFVGGPTHYKPLRDRVCFELGIKGSTEVNPMTVVAEGAAMFAESIDWRYENRRQKSSRGKLSVAGALDLKLSYAARTPDKQAKISIQVGGDVMLGTEEVQVDSLETGWTSGRLPLKDGMTIDVSLPRNGENQFKVFVFDAAGGPSTHRVFITRVAATVDAIPASHSIALEVLQKLGGSSIPLWLVRAEDHLPKKKTGIVKAGQSLKAGSHDSLYFKLWEGESDVPSDNRDIGCLKVTGEDFDDGVIVAGDDLQYDFEMLDSGAIRFKVSIPRIGFRSEKNFYSRQEGQADYSSSSELEQVSEDGRRMLQRIEEVEAVVDDPKLEQARMKLVPALRLDEAQDAEHVKEARDGVDEARRQLAHVRKEHCQPIRQLELDKVSKSFNENGRQYARPSEEKAFDNLVRTAQRSIDRNENDFENHLSELKSRNFTILWRQDWYVIDFFNNTLKPWPRFFSDAVRFKELAARGTSAIKNDDIDELRQVVNHLFEIYIFTSSDDNITQEITNIIRG